MHHALALLSYCEEKQGRDCRERLCLTTGMMPGLGTCSLSLHFTVLIKPDKHQHSTPGVWWDLWGLLGRFLMGELAVTGEGVSTGVCTGSENQVLSHLTAPLQQWLNTTVLSPSMVSTFQSGENSSSWFP